MSSRRSKRSRTGRPVSSASAAARAQSSEGTSSLPPKAPPVGVWITRTLASGSPQARPTAFCT